MKKSAVVFDSRKLKPPGILTLLSLAVLSFVLFFSFQKYFLTDPHTAMAQSPQTVNIQNMQFIPSQMAISVGSTLTWTNQDSVAHTVTSDSNLWDSGVLQPGQSFAMRFMSPGTYTYHCRIHPFMHGTIVVTSTISPSPSSLTPTPTSQYSPSTTSPQTTVNMPSQPIYYPANPTYSYSVPAHTDTQTQNQSQSVSVSGGSSGVNVQQNESQSQTLE